MAFRLRPGPLAAAALLSAASFGCVQGNQKTQKPFEELTIDNLVTWPDGREYLEATAVMPPETVAPDQESRRKSAREAAVMAAQKELIEDLKKMVPRNKIHELLRQAEVAKVSYGYDDRCTLTLRIAKELIRGPEKPW